jgi:hypothetical protein
MHRIGSIVIALSCFALSLFGCGSLQYEVNPHYNKGVYKRVGLLVVRVGNQKCRLPLPITSQTNYANRRSEPATGRWDSSDAAFDVYIEEEARLHESLPGYPYCYRRDNGAYTKFYRNITPQLSGHLGQMLTTKGYEVVDLRRTALGWDKPISEMTVDEILGRSRGTVDAVFIFHYSDRGDVFGYVAQREREFSSTGFSALGYSGAMFDVATNERILSFRPKFFRTENITRVIAADPEVRADPLQSGKVLKSGDDAAISMSDEEVVEHVAKYICHGVKWGWNEWTGLDAVVP